MKTHWLYGSGPNHEIKFKKEIDKETKCQTCVHRMVCNYDMSKRCINYEFGTSQERSEICASCLHRFTRFDKDETKIPCFCCKDFLKKK